MLAKRMGLACFDLAAFLVMGLTLVAGTPMLAFAYVDPSVMTYTIQALAGVAVALSTVFGVVYRRVRKRMVVALGIDENKNKVIDPDVRRIEPEEREEVKEEAAAFWGAAPVPGKALPWSPGKRALRALAIAFFLAFTLFIVAPFELVAANTNDLVFGLKDVWFPMAKVALSAVIVITALLTVFPGRVGDVIASIACALGVCMWVQAMFLNAGLPSADGAEIEWATRFLGQMILSAIVWIAIIAAFVVLTIRENRKFRPAVIAVALALVFVQGVGVVSLFVSTPEGGNSEYGASFQITQKGMFDVAPDSNVVVIVLDMFDYEDMRVLYNDNRKATEELTGFTWYTDASGSLIPTRMAVPYLLSGQFPQDGDTYSSYVENRMKRSTFIEDMADAGYNIGIYTDTFPYPSTLTNECDFIMNVGVALSDFLINEEGAARILTQTALYRDLPWMFKEPFWYYTDQINQAMTIKVDEEVADEDKLYVIDDAAYDDQLLDKGLTVVDRGDKGAFRFIHLNGAHYPYTVDANGDAPGHTTSRDEQALGALKIACDYVRALKEAGVYDNTTIILTADHGWFEFNDGEHDTCTYASTPIWMIKPAGLPDWQKTQPLKIVSNVPTGHMDFHSTVLKAMGVGDRSKYGPATDEVVPNSPRLREYYFLVNSIEDYSDIELQQYHILGNATDFRKWGRTGKVYPNDDKRYHG